MDQKVKHIILDSVGNKVMRFTKGSYFLPTNCIHYIGGVMLFSVGNKVAHIDVSLYEPPAELAGSRLLEVSFSEFGTNMIFTKDGNTFDVQAV